MRIAQQIEDILKKEFRPKTIIVTNNSYKHKGHSGDDGTGETHFLIEISEKDIPGEVRFQKHKNIVKILDDIYKKAHSIEIRLV